MYHPTRIGSNREDSKTIVSGWPVLGLVLSVVQICVSGSMLSFQRGTWIHSRCEISGLHCNLFVSGDLTRVYYSSMAQPLEFAMNAISELRDRQDVIINVSSM
jgi:hypothetical protein